MDNVYIYIFIYIIIYISIYKYIINIYYLIKNRSELYIYTHKHTPLLFKDHGTIADNPQTVYLFLLQL